MKSKKLLSIIAIAALSATVIGSSLAYFTDTDQAENVFTSGKVDIKIIEQQRKYDSNGVLLGLEDFTDGAKFLPVVTNDTYDAYGLSLDENYVDKIITVQNLEEDAYIRVFTAIPAELENLNGVDSLDVLHVEFGDIFSPVGGKTDSSSVNADFANWTSNTLEHAGVKLEGYGDTLFNVYMHTYEKALTKDEITGSACVVGMYLDANIDHNGTNYIYKQPTGDINITYDLTDIKIPVFAQGVQKAGFNSADAAFTAAGFTTNPWEVE